MADCANTGEVFLFENVASLNASTLPVGTSLTPNSTFGMNVPAEADLVVQPADLDGSGSQPWIFSCYGRAVYARPLDGSGSTVILNMNGLNVDNNEQARSMWGYNDGSVYCAYTTDSNPLERQVIQVLTQTANVPANSVDFFVAAPPQGTALSRLSNAQDGLNCLNAVSPYPGAGTTTTTTILPCEATPFDCTQYPGPLQVVNSAGSGSSCVSTIQFLNLATEQYEPICNSQPGECQQGCSYNPKDGRIYCQSVNTFRNIGRYLTRIDCNGTTQEMKICYLDPFTRNVVTAAFVEEPFTNFPNYVFSDNRIRNVRADVTTLDGFVDPPFVWPELATDQISSSGFGAVSMAISRFDLGDGNGVQTWAIGCNAGQIVVQGISNISDNFLRGERYTLTIVDAAPQGRSTTAWSFENNVYCAYNDAVYFLFTDFITINQVTRTGTISLGEASSATTNNGNADNGGLQCNTPDPFPVVTTSTTTSTTEGPLLDCFTEAWNCTNSSNFSTLALQVINEREDGICVRGTIQSLDVQTGIYTPICTFPLGECFNGCGINPVDDQIYCFTEERDPEIAFLTRLSCPVTDLGCLSNGYFL